MPAAEYKLANPPFDDDNADVVLHSSDGVDFLLQKLILSQASPRFARMFAHTAGRSSKRSDEPQVVPVPENAHTLDALLAFIYPGVARPVFSSFDELCPVLVAARKHAMAAVIADIGHDILRLLQAAHRDRAGDDDDNNDAPLRAYALACLAKRTDVALAAARLLLNARPRPALEPHKIHPEFAVLPSDHLLALAAFLSECRAAAAAAAGDELRDAPLPALWPWGCEWGYLSDRPRYAARVRPEWVVCQRCRADDAWTLTAGADALRQGAAWWRVYARRVGELVAAHPTALSAGSVGTGLVGAVLIEAALCSDCAPRVREFLGEVTEELAGKIEKAVNAVALRLPVLV